MSDNVIDIGTARPSAAGVAVCMNCKYRWAVACIVGTHIFECPECGSSKGRLDSFLERGNYIYKCTNCSGDLFSICEDGIYCANCGEYQSADDIDNTPPPIGA